MKHWVLILFATTFGHRVWSATADVVLTQEKVAFFSPGVLNTKFFNFEFGFITNKKIKTFDYSYNAFANIFMAEESYATPEQLRAGALGFKGGIFLPTQPWYPLFLMAAIGYAKTAFHEDPWFGKREKSVATRDMFLVEVGGSIAWNNFLFRYMYQLNTVKYFTRKSMFSFGASF